jgi:hypothetical protein
MNADNFKSKKLSLTKGNEMNMASMEHSMASTNDYGAFSNGNDDELQLPEPLHSSKRSYRKRLLYYVLAIVLIVFIVSLLGRLVHLALKMIKEHGEKKM